MPTCPCGTMWSAPGRAWPVFAPWKGSEYFRAQGRGFPWVRKTLVHRRTDSHESGILVCTGEW
eukprot:12409830-Karenia_brevis.AAC.1